MRSNAYHKKSGVKWLVKNTTRTDLLMKRSLLGARNLHTIHVEMHNLFYRSLRMILVVYGLLNV